MSNKSAVEEDIFEAIDFWLGNDLMEGERLDAMKKLIHYEPELITRRIDQRAENERCKNACFMCGKRQERHKDSLIMISIVMIDLPLCSVECLRRWVHELPSAHPQEVLTAAVREIKETNCPRHLMTCRLVKMLLQRGGFGLDYDAVEAEFKRQGFQDDPPWKWM